MNPIPDSPDDDDSSNLLPLIDVLLVALLFFLATHRSIGSIDPIRGGSGSSVDGPVPVVVELTETGVVRFESRVVTEVELLEKLQERRPECVAINAEKSTPIQTVVRLHGVCRKAASKVSILTQNP